MKIIILLSVLTFQVFAQDCSTVNHVTSANSPLERIPVADQDGTGICYAYTTSQLMNYHLIKTGQASAPAIHPVWTALKSSRRILQQGYEHEAITAIRDNGSCNYSRVENTLNAFGANANLSGSPLVSFLETYSMELNKLARQNQGNVTQAMVQRAFNKATDETAPHCGDDVLWERLLPQLTPVNETSVQLFTRLLRDTCPAENISRFNIPEPLTAGAFESNEVARLTLHDQMDKGPFLFSYCSEAWYNTSYNGMTRPTNESASDCGMHSSMAVGRKQIGPHCYMLVRNSWGTTWSDWNQGSTCLCRHKVTRAWVDECTEATHNDGNYTVEACYMGQNLLSRNLQEITTFNP